MTVTLEVEHVTTYRYAQPVEFGEHRVAFHPRAAHDIRVLNVSLDVTPHSEQRWIHDVFSNSMAIVRPLVPARELTFRARFSVEHHGVKNEELPVAPEAEFYPFEYTAEDRHDLSTFLPLQYPDDAPAVRDWVASFLPARGRIHTRDVLANLNSAIRSDFVYAARDAMGTQRPALTLQSRSGTCRDFALLMIEAARGLGLAARFVSGYIYDPALDDAQGAPAQDVQSRDACGTLGSGATHAWLHVFLPGAGWVPFDPTNTLFGGTDLIRVAYTRTPEQAAPVSGSWSGGQATIRACRCPSVCAGSGRWRHDGFSALSLTRTRAGHTTPRPARPRRRRSAPSPTPSPAPARCTGAIVTVRNDRLRDGQGQAAAA